MKLVAPLTHSDWQISPIAGSGGKRPVFGAEGVHHMLDACKAAGWTRILWRCFDAGQTTYHSKLADPGINHYEKDNIGFPASPEDAKLLADKYSWNAPAYQESMKLIDDIDYGKFDSLAEAVRYGHEIGLEVWAWFSINEDDHGWGWPSRFTKQHPECRWVRRDGTAYHSQISFGFPKARAYKLGLVKELVANYAIDGVFLDWIRTGDIRDNPQTDPDGVANYGYEAPLVESFKRKYGVDPHTLPNGDDRWVRWRAQPITLYMRSVRKAMRALKPNLPLAVMVYHPWAYRGAQDRIDGNLRGSLLDVRTWAKERLFDAAVAAGYYMNGGNPDRAFTALRDEVGGSADVWWYAWVPSTAAGFEADVASAKKAGASTMLLWEANYIDLRDNRAELQQAMRLRSR
jgi:hypothetical protein